MSLWHRGDREHTRGGNYGKSTCFIKMIFFAKAKEVGGFGARKDGNESADPASIEGGYKNVCLFTLLWFQNYDQIYSRYLLWFFFVQKLHFLHRTPPLCLT